jgi:X-X-X-Leu-X-X-Gly heptad repeat protein
MILNKRIPRDLKANFSRWFAIFILTVLGMYMVISLMASAEVVIRNENEYNQKNHLEDGEFSVFAILTENDINKLEEIGITIEPIFHLDYLQDDGSTVRVFKNRTSINIIYPNKGHIPEKDDEVLVEQHYAEEHNLSIGDSLNIGSKKLNVCGIGVTPDYDNVLQNMSDISAEGKKFGTAFVTENTFHDIEKLNESSCAETYLYSYIIDNNNITDIDIRNAICDLDFNYETVDDEFFNEMIDEINADKLDLEKNIDDLVNGSSLILDSSIMFKDGSNKLYDAINEFYAQFDDFSSSIKTLNSGLKTLNDSSADLTKGADKIFDTFLIQSKNQLKTYGIDVELTKSNYQSVLNETKNDLSRIGNEASAEINSLINSLSQIETFYDSICLYTQGASNAQQGLQTISSGISQIKQLTVAALQTSSQIASTNPGSSEYHDMVQQSTVINGAIENVNASVNEINNGFSSLTENNDALILGADNILSSLLNMIQSELSDYKFDQTLSKDNYSYVLSSFSENLPSTLESSAKSGIDELINSINSYNTFHNGLNSYVNGVNEVSQGVCQLNDVTYNILDASSQMLSSSNELNEYANEMQDSANKLNDSVVDFQNSSNDMLDSYFKLDIDNLVRFTKSSDNPRIGNSIISVTTRKSEGLFCGVIVIILIGYVISVFIVHNIDEESSVIGALYSMGISKSELIRHYITMPSLLAFFGGLIGTIIGYSPLGCGIQLEETIRSNSTPTFYQVYDAGIIAYGVLLPPIIASIVTILVINKRLSNPPIKLLKNEKTQGSIVKLELNKVNFINTFRLRRLMSEVKTSIAVFIGMFIPVLLIILAVDCFVGIDKLENDIKSDVSYKYLYSIKYPSSEIPSNSEDAYIETFKMSSWGAELDVNIMGINENSEYFDFKMDGEKNTVYVGSGASNKFDIKKGDIVSLTSSSDNRVYSFKVANIVPYSIGFNIFMDINDMRDVFSRNDDYYNVLLSYDKLDIESGRVYSITSQDDLLKVAPNIRKSMSSITYLMITGSILTYIVVMYLMIKLMIQRSAQNISLMKIFGYNKKEIRKLYLDSNFIIIVISALLSVPLAKVIIDELWFKMMIASLSTSMITAFEPHIYICFYVCIFILYFIISVILRKSLNAVSLVEVLKNRE